MARAVRSRRLRRGPRLPSPRTSRACATRCSRRVRQPPATAGRRHHPPRADRPRRFSQPCRSCATLLAQQRWRALLAYVASTRAEPLYYIQTDPQRPRRRRSRPAARASRRHLPPLAQGVAVPDRRHRRPGAADLCPRLASADPRAPRLGAGAQRRHHDSDRLSQRGSLRIAPEELPALGLPPAAALRGPRQYPRRHRHLRLPRPGQRRRPTCAPRSGPMLAAPRSCPWTGFDLLSLAADRHPPRRLAPRASSTGSTGSASRGSTGSRSAASAR